MKNKVITEEFLEEKLLDLREGIIDQVNAKIDQHRDEILTGLDKIVKELETMREENSVGNFQMNERLEDHEKRITNLEPVIQ